MKRMLALAGLLLLLVSCGTELTPVQETQDFQELQEPQVKRADGLVFYASFEESSAPGTKVFMNDDWKLHWNAGDQISIFNKTNDNLQFGFNGADNDASGNFSAVNPNATINGSAVPHIYAVYPYASGTTVAADGTISLTLPAEQAYYGGVSFGRGANTMVSATDNEQDKLYFRNVCGYLQIKLYGEGASVAKVTLKGNAGEPLAGAARVAATTDGAPSVEMQNGAATEVSLVCSTPVALNKEADNYTTFMLAIPPTQFTGGFTVTVTDSDGFMFERKTTNSYTVARNEIFPMAPLNIREVEEFSIENEGVRGYMTVDYSSDPDYTLSYVDQYKSTASDEPMPFTVSVSGARKVSVKSLAAAYPLEWTVTGTNSISVYNLVPGVVYHYDVFGEQDALLKSGFVRPVGQVRMIHGVVDNFRDLGGWQASGGTIAYGKLFRGYELPNLPSETQKNIFLNDLGISVDLDLRGYNNSGTPSNPLKPAVAYENLQLWKFLGKGTGTTQELYQKAIRDIIGWLGEGLPIYFHCIGGADRTGTLAFLIEALVGVSESDLSKDYELTSFDGSHSRKRNDNKTTNPEYIYTWLIDYLRTFEGNTINEKVVNWAKTPFSDSVAPLSDDEIALLRQYLVVTE